MKKGKWIDYCLIALFITICVLSCIGKLRYGTGLGDLTYILIAGASAFAFAFVSHMIRNSDQVYFTITRILFGLILFYLIYSFTLGRGAELSWDGTVFF